MYRLAILFFTSCALADEPLQNDGHVWEYNKDYNHIQYMSCGHTLYSEQSELTFWIEGKLTSVSVEHVVNYWHLNYLAGKYGEAC